MGDVGSPAPQALPRKVHEEEIKRAARKGRFFNWGGSGSEMRRVVVGYESDSICQIQFQMEQIVGSKKGADAIIIEQNLRVSLGDQWCSNLGVGDVRNSPVR